MFFFTDTFTNYFSKYGEIADSVIMLDKHTGRPRGFGFITFADPVAADAVLEEEHIIDGRVVTFYILLHKAFATAEFQIDSWVAI